VFVVVDRDITVTDMAHESVLFVLLLTSTAFSAVNAEGKVLICYNAIISVA